MLKKGSAMKTYLFLVLLFALFFITIVAAYKPSAFEKEYNKIQAPVANYIAVKRADEWRVAKAKAWQDWEKKIKLSAYCAHPHTSIEELECQNQLQNEAGTFNQVWANKVASGWKPDGVY